jgi:hypothetical protein
MNLEAIQSALREAKLDGWLFYDHHRRDPIAYRVLNINPVMCTRRWYYVIPREGEPAKLVHRIEAHNLAGLPGTEERYSSWREQREGLGRLLHDKKLVAMQYSALNNIPYVGLVDAGTVELVKSCGVEVVSSADLVQQFEASWSEEQWQSHRAARWCTRRCGRRSRPFVMPCAPARRSANTTYSRKWYGFLRRTA